MKYFLIILLISIFGCSSVDEDIETETIRFGDEIELETKKSKFETELEDNCPMFCQGLWSECVRKSEEMCGDFPYPPEIWTTCESKSYYQTCDHLEKGCLIDCYDS